MLFLGAPRGMLPRCTGGGDGRCVSRTGVRGAAVVVVGGAAVPGVTGPGAWGDADRSSLSFERGAGAALPLFPPAAPAVA